MPSPSPSATKRESRICSSGHSFIWSFSERNLVIAESGHSSIWSICGIWSLSRSALRDEVTARERAEITRSQDRAVSSIDQIARWPICPAARFAE
jgi:hypothetical protein